MPRAHEAQDDDLLIAKIAGGDGSALAGLVERHGRALFRLARAFASSEAEAEDIVQETFLATLRGASTYRADASGAQGVRTWLFAIARNTARHVRRKTSREVPSPSVGDTDDDLLGLGIAAGWGDGAVATPSSQQTPPDQRLERAETAERLARAVASLPAADREILVLRDVEQLGGEEAAYVLGVGVRAMKSRLHRARLRLMAVLREQEGGVVTSEKEIAGLTCSAVLERLGDYVDGELDAQDVARVDEHLRGCTVCERFGGRYASVVHAAREKLGAAHEVDEVTLRRVEIALGLRS